MTMTNPPRVTDACFGDALRLLRWMKGLRRAALAAACGLSERALADREKGLRPLMASEVVDVGLALGIPVPHVFAVAEGLALLTSRERAALMRPVIQSDERAERRAVRGFAGWAALLAASVATLLIAAAWPETDTAADVGMTAVAERVWCQWCPPVL